MTDQTPKGRYGFLALGVLLGICLGAAAMWFQNGFAAPNEPLLKDHEALIALIKSADTTIADENFACELEGRTAADVLVGRGFIAPGSSTFGRTTFGCSAEEGCTLMISSCRPGQTSECGQTFLRYRLDSANTLIPTSLSCLDVP